MIGLSTQCLVSTCLRRPPTTSFPSQANEPDEPTLLPTQWVPRLLSCTVAGPPQLSYPFGPPIITASLLLADGFPFWKGGVPTQRYAKLAGIQPGEMQNGAPPPGSKRRNSDNLLFQLRLWPRPKGTCHMSFSHCSSELFLTFLLFLAASTSLFNERRLQRVPLPGRVVCGSDPRVRRHLRQNLCSQQAGHGGGLCNPRAALGGTMV